MISKHAPQYFICRPLLKSQNFQRVQPHMSSYTYLGSITYLFVVRLLSRMLRTLWVQNPAFIKQCILQRQFFFCTRPSNWLYVQNQHKQEIWRPEISHSAIFFLKPLCKQCSFYKLHRDLCSRDLCWVPHSGSIPRWVPPSRLPKDWKIPSARKGSWAVGHPAPMSHWWIL